MQSLLSYKYHDTPEGQDVFMKTFALSKYAAVTGLGFATFDILMYSHPEGIVKTAGRYLWYIGPLVGMASAFTVTTNLAQNIRGKNDEINYFLGGVAAGSIAGAWQRTMTAGVPLALILGAAAIVAKTGKDQGWNFFPEVKQMTKTISSVRHDWTLAKDIEELKNFTTGPK